LSGIYGFSKISIFIAVMAIYFRWSRK